MQCEMIVSSVYSWLKEIRSTFDSYDEKISSTENRRTNNSNFNQRNSCLYCNCKCNCNLFIMPSTCEDRVFEIFHSGLLFSREHFPRRSLQFQHQHQHQRKTELRSKKAWSVGDAWGLDFQLPKNASPISNNIENDDLSEVFKEFAFLSDAELELAEESDAESVKQPIYMNIATISNTKLEQQIKDNDNLNYSTLSSTCSFVSLTPSEFSDFSGSGSSATSGTYTLPNSARTSTFSFAMSEHQDEENWKNDQWKVLKTDGQKVQYDLDDVKMRKRLTKGKSLESFNLQKVSNKRLAIYKDVAVDNKGDKDLDAVQLRKKDNRRSCIPVLGGAEERKAIIVPKVKITESGQSNYMNIWECHTKSTESTESTAINRKVKPVPLPRKKLQAGLKVQHGRENIVSFAFDETVEILAPEVDAIKRSVSDQAQLLPTPDVIMWLSRLMTECENEPEFDYEIPTSYPSESTSFGHASPSERKTSKNNESGREAITKEPEMNKFSPAHFYEMEKLHKSSQEHIELTKLDLNLDFTNVKKYKLDNQIVKLGKGDVLEITNNKLVHKIAGEQCKILAKLKNNCKIDKRNEKEIILTVDDVKICIYRETPSPKVDNVRTRLMLFFKKRPVVAVLREKGIYKNESVFGNTLAQLEQKHKTCVPELVRKCIEYVELPQNIVTEGLYRSSASLATLQDIRFTINQNESRDLSILEKYKNTPDVPSGLLKLFIRELKESLIREEDFEQFAQICSSNESTESKQRRAMEVVEQMVPTHRETLDLLLRHLIKVAQYERQNGMSVISVAICWGQTMSSFPEASDGVLMAKKKNEVVELLLQTYLVIFPPEIDDFEQYVPRKHSTPSKSMHNLTAGSNFGGREREHQQDDPPSPLHKKLLVQKSMGHLPFASSKSVDWDKLSAWGSSSDLSVSSYNVASTDANSKIQNPKFIGQLISKIELSDINGIYKGKGNIKTVRKIIDKSKKKQSKELGKLMDKADAFTLGQVLKEIVKEDPYRLSFEDMQTVVEKYDVERMREIVTNMPKHYKMLCRHFQNLDTSSVDSVTTLVDVFECWGPILIAKPTNVAEERVGGNLDTFKKFYTTVLEQTHILEQNEQNTTRSASLGDLRWIEEMPRKLCYTKSTNQL